MTYRQRSTAIPASTTLRHAERIGRKFQNPVPTELGGLGMALKLIPLYLANKEERTPRRPLGPFLTDPAAYAAPPISGLRITWFGHSSTLVEIDGLRVLMDPVWDERASPVRWAGPARFFAPTLPLARLPELDAILFSHDHYDHLGAQTVRTLAALPNAERAQWIAPLAVGAVLGRFGVASRRVTELDWTDAFTVRSARTGGFLEITALPARHFSGRGLRDRWETLWASYALRGAEHNLYYGADSGFWNGFGEIARLHGPFDLTMLDTGAWNRRWESIHMGPDGARRAFAAMGSHGLLMPVHWGLFDLALHAWRWPMERITALADQHGIPLWSPTPGVPTEVEKNTELRSPWWL